MERWIPAIVLVPALVWPACNGGTENLGNGEGGSAGAELTSTSTGDSADDMGGDVGGSGGNGAGGSKSTSTSSSGSNSSGGNSSGGNSSGGSNSGGNSSGGNSSGGNNGWLPDSGPIGPGSTNSGAGGAGGTQGAGGYGFTNTSGNGAGGAGGGPVVYGEATRIYQSSQVIPALTHDAEQLYTGGTTLASIPIPSGSWTLLDTATYDARVAVDDTHLYVCSAGSLYRMSKYGGGTQNFSGVEPDFSCSAVSVDDTTVSAAWFNAEAQRLQVHRWAKSNRTEPESSLDLDEVGPAYAPAFIADSALYYADRSADELLIGRIQLDDFTDEQVLAVDAEFDSEYLAPLAANEAALYYQSCEQVDRWCSLFQLPTGDDEPIAFEMFQRDAVVKALAPYGAGAVIALSSGIHRLESVEAELEPLWTHPNMLGFGPLLILGTDLYLVSNPTYGSGSMLWRYPLGEL